MQKKANRRLYIHCGLMYQNHITESCSEPVNVVYPKCAKKKPSLTSSHSRSCYVPKKSNIKWF